jgi:hypothetical protein
MSLEPDKIAGWQEGEAGLAPLAEQERLAVLALFEQEAKRRAKLDWLRAIREYREKVPRSTPPPQSA